VRDLVAPRERATAVKIAEKKTRAAPRECCAATPSSVAAPYAALEIAAVRARLIPGSKSEGLRLPSRGLAYSRTTKKFYRIT
jgi:hypothetical protein